MIEATTKIRNQPGPQRQFNRTLAQIAIFGGSAGGGKTMALLLDPLRHIHNPNFGAVIFRKTNVQIRGEGGLWDESEKLYPFCGAIGSRHTLRWKFPSGAQISFSHLEPDKDRFNWMGQQIAMIGFDELTHFSAEQFWYLQSRNRSMCGIPPYMRCTCNPDADSFVAKLIEWWIDQETGYAIKERSGVIRWFARIGDELQWGASAEELIERFPDCSPQSLTFIRSELKDNQILLKSDPSYLAKLKNMQRVERERLLMGNWKIRAAAGMYFKQEYFERVKAAPADVVAVCRYWDRAGGKPLPNKPRDWTAGVRLSMTRQNIFYVEHVARMQESPHIVETAMINTASNDQPGTIVGYMQDPGSAGENEAKATAGALKGYNVRFRTATGDKVTRAKPASAQAEAGNIKIVEGNWNDAFLTELENFPEGAHDDQVDALSGAFNELANYRPILLA